MRELRFIQQHLEVRQQNGKPMIRGYAARFNSLSYPLGGPAVFGLLRSNAVFGGVAIGVLQDVHGEFQPVLIPASASRRRKPSTQF